MIITLAPLPFFSFSIFGLLVRPSLLKHPPQPDRLDLGPHAIHLSQFSDQSLNLLPRRTLRLLLPPGLKHIRKLRQEPVDMRHEQGQECRMSSGGGELEEPEEGGEDGGVLDEVVLCSTTKQLWIESARVWTGRDGEGRD